jgi:hypothetical protein
MLGGCQTAVGGASSIWLAATTRSYGGTPERRNGLGGGRGGGSVARMAGKKQKDGNWKLRAAARKADSNLLNLVSQRRLKSIT